MKDKNTVYKINPRFTEAQKKAILSDGDIIVSAAAGSGKTTTMIERILRIVIEGLEDGNKDVLKNLLVLVYNNAAAEDIKEKLRLAILKAIEKPAYESIAADLRTQLRELQFCDISTIHSYCQNLIRNYFETLGITSNFEVLDETQHASYMDKALDITFEKMSGDEGEEAADKDAISFFNLSKVFAEGRKDDSFKSIVIKLFQAMDIQEDREAFKQKVIASYENFDNSVFLRDILDNYKTLISRAYKLFDDEKYNAFRDDGKEDKYAMKVAETKDLASRLLECMTFDGSKTYAQILEAMNGVISDTSITDATKSNCSEAYKYLADEIKPVFDVLNDDKNNIGVFKKISKLHSDMAEYKKANEQNLAYVKKLFEVAESFGETLAKLKSEKNVLAFEDLQHYAYRLLCDEEFEKPKFDAIFVDEYQDVNPTQEAIIKKILEANVGNSFFVGDVKQSIYGFRLADPEIFLKRFETYKEGDEKFAMSFDNNFRSAKNILDFVNDVFNVVMTPNPLKDGEVKDVDYKKDGKFNLDTDNIGGNVEVHVFYDDASEKKEAEKKAKSKGKEPENTEEQKEAAHEVKVYDITTAENKRDELKAEDHEAMFVVNEIKNLVDHAKEDGRYLSYDDIVILARYWKNFDKVKKYMKMAGIPFEDAAPNDENGGPEKPLLMFLNSIDNPRQDYAFAGYLLSFFGGYSEQELAIIADSTPADCLYDKFVIFKEKKTDGLSQEARALVEKVKRTFGELSLYQRKASFKSVRELAGGIIADYSYDAYLARKGMASVDAVRRFVSSISDTDNESLSRFLRNLSENANQDSAKLATVSVSKSQFEKAIISFLLVVENVNKDGAVRDLAQSKIFGISGKEIEIALNEEGSSLFEKLAKHKAKDEEEQDRITNFVDAVNLARADERTNSCVGAFLQEWLEKFREKFKDKDTGEEQEYVEAKLFVDSIPSNIKSASQLLDVYFKSATTGKVKFSTMHGYKGLESEVVFVIKTDAQFKDNDYKGHIAIDASGIVSLDGFDFDAYTSKETIAKKAAKIKIKERMRKEEMRLFYVALTRAKSRMYVTASLSQEAKKTFGKKSLDDPKSMIDFINIAVANGGGKKLSARFPRYVATSGTEYATPLSEIVNLGVYPECTGEENSCGYAISAPDERYKRLIEDAQAFVYPYKKETELSVKYSVSALDSMKDESEDFTPRAYSEDGASIGTIYHKIMQNIDFDLTSEEEVKDAIERMKEGGVLTKDEMDLLNKDSKDYVKRITKCLASEVMRYAAKNRCMREKSFMMYQPANKVSDKLDSKEEVLVQGIIDLLILGEKTIIVDFKYSPLKDEKTKEMYEKQLNLYKMAVESAIGAKKVDEIGLYSFITNEYITF